MGLDSRITLIKNKDGKVVYAELKLIVKSKELVEQLKQTGHLIRVNRSNLIETIHFISKFNDTSNNNKEGNNETTKKYTSENSELNQNFDKIIIQDSLNTPFSNNAYFTYHDTQYRTEYVVNRKGKTNIIFSEHRNHDKITPQKGRPIITFDLSNINHKPIFVIDNTVNPNDLFVIDENEYKNTGLLGQNVTQLTRAVDISYDRLQSGYILVLCYKNPPNSHDTITKISDIDRQKNDYKLIHVADHGTMNRKAGTPPSKSEFINLSDYFEVTFDTSLDKRLHNFYSGKKIAISLPEIYYTVSKSSLQHTLLVVGKDIVEDNYDLYDPETKTYRKAVILKQKDLNVLIRKVQGLSSNSVLTNTPKIWIGINSGHGMGFEITKIPVRELFAQ